MKEQIIKILKSTIYADGDIFVMWYEEGFNDIANEIETLIATEVERRIAERLPSEEECIDWAKDETLDIDGGDNKEITFYLMTGANWLRSRLTENKQEGGEG